MMTGRQTAWRSVWLAGVLLTAPSSPTIAGDAADKEARRLDGTWRFLSLKSDGEDAPEEVIGKWRWVIRDRVLTIPGPGNGEGKSSLKIDPSKSPKAIDITGVDGPGKGETVECIYKIEGERLTICLPGGKGGSPGRPRPEEFSGGESMSLVVLERVKDE
jgi:uncharacterized protein (TIGR03067 family)